METKFFWKPIDGGEFKELKGVSKVEFKPLEKPVNVEYDLTPVTHSISFDMEIDKCNIRKLLYTRVPRKKKKLQKKWIAWLDGKPVKHLRYDYLGCYYWIK